jgi:hypothetical protein
MNDTTRLKYLRIALVLVGIIFIVGIYLLMIVWPSGWMWHTGHSDYPLTIIGVYATLGVFVLLAARRPLDNLSLIWFTVWPSVVHAGIMAFQSIRDASESWPLGRRRARFVRCRGGAGISHPASRCGESPRRNGLTNRWSRRRAGVITSFLMTFFSFPAVTRTLARCSPSWSR